jgi:hypothetical protein
MTIFEGFVLRFIVLWILREMARGADRMEADDLLKQLSKDISNWVKETYEKN